MRAIITSLGLPLTPRRTSTAQVAWNQSASMAMARQGRPPRTDPRRPQRSPYAMPVAAGSPNPMHVRSVMGSSFTVPASCLSPSDPTTTHRSSRSGWLSQCCIMGADRRDKRRFLLARAGAASSIGPGSPRPGPSRLHSTRRPSTDQERRVRPRKVTLLPVTAPRSRRTDQPETSSP